TWMLNTLGSFWFMFILYRNLTVPYAKYILWGSAFLLLGGVVSILLTLLKRYPVGIHMDHPLIFLRIGFLLEVFCFSFTLGLRARDTEQDKIRAEQLVQLSKSALLETEIKALRAQINPHFIANCLNSIKSLIQQTRKEEAIEYLIRFSKLIRAVVDYSLQSRISLRQELQLSDWYVELEALRLGHHFHYERSWQHSEVDIDYLEVPPFLLQPFLENAIWHGFDRQGEAENWLSISLEEREDGIYCLIEDNGIGRIKAAQRPDKKKHSIGLQNVEDRLLLLNQLEGSDLRIQLLDKPQHQGTVVEIYLGF
ncbi:MAG: histidine kinase, partial [Bacteroidota bacterium]